jgi:hypothetical protein
MNAAASGSTLPPQHLAAAAAFVLLLLHLAASCWRVEGCSHGVPARGRAGMLLLLLLLAGRAVAAWGCCCLHGHGGILLGPPPWSGVYDAGGVGGGWRRWGWEWGPAGGCAEWVGRACGGRRLSRPCGVLAAGGQSAVTCYAPGLRFRLPARTSCSLLVKFVTNPSESRHIRHGLKGAAPRLCT